jgi:two-component system, LytTR family, response regulator
MIHKILIIDDEEPARNLLKAYLKNQDSFELIGEAGDGFSAVKAINEQKPDVVFLDIQMPRLTGFEVLELIEHQPVVVFATAFDQFAIKAFEANAVDYLLKPFSKERFLLALDKAKAKLASVSASTTEISKIVKTIDENPEYIERVAVKSGNKVHVVAVQDIQYFEAEGDYVRIVTSDSRFLKEKTMKYFETHLEPDAFVRIHRSYIVNVNFIGRIEYYDKESYIVFLKNNVQLKASSAGYKLLKKILNM